MDTKMNKSLFFITGMTMLVFFCTPISSEDGRPKSIKNYYEVPGDGVIIYNGGFAGAASRYSRSQTRNQVKYYAKKQKKKTVSAGKKRVTQKLFGDITNRYTRKNKKVK